jgi:hypothetical protein
MQVHKILKLYHVPTALSYILNYRDYRYFGPMGRLIRIGRGKFHRVYFNLGSNIWASRPVSASLLISQLVKSGKGALTIGREICRRYFINTFLPDHF